ncbi:unnamed protein product [Pleuronectes platessa]|uniref:Uncharacterized protein n=1 Tax=Pleuronectes platessa TaxID=8262 RepID=A0A9N7YQA4_PLEPL|nr:unnamed protein product [Pleuronectes platessa]
MKPDEYSESFITHHSDYTSNRSRPRSRLSATRCTVPPLRHRSATETPENDSLPGLSELSLTSLVSFLFRRTMSRVEVKPGIKLRTETLDVLISVVPLDHRSLCTILFEPAGSCYDLFDCVGLLLQILFEPGGHWNVSGPNHIISTSGFTAAEADPSGSAPWGAVRRTRLWERPPPLTADPPGKVFPLIRCHSTLDALNQPLLSLLIKSNVIDKRLKVSRGNRLSWLTQKDGDSQSVRLKDQSHPGHINQTGFCLQPARFTREEEKFSLSTRVPLTQSQMITQLMAQTLNVWLNENSLLSK